MNSKGRWTMAAATLGLILMGCSSNHSTATGSTPSNPTGPSNSAPTDFASFVNQQVIEEPAFGTTPAVTTSLTTDLALGNATAFSGVSFGKGDALPAGTFQAATACTAAGVMVCNPTVSADPNSNLN